MTQGHTYFQTVLPMRNYLAAIYPNCFTAKDSGIKKRPLKRGIHLDILRDFPHMDKHDLKTTLHAYGRGVCNDGLMVVGTPRIDLIGNEVGEVVQADVTYYQSIKQRFNRNVKQKEAA